VPSCTVFRASTRNSEPTAACSYWTSLVTSHNVTVYISVYFCSSTTLQSPTRARNSFLLYNPLVPTHTPVQWVWGTLSWAVKWLECEASYSPPSSGKVKNECSCTSSTPYAFMVHIGHLYLNTTHCVLVCPLILCVVCYYVLLFLYVVC
jgi:hypothetical protein